MKAAEAKAKKEIEEAKRKKEEEEDGYDSQESDHHGRIFIDYRLPKPNVFPVSWRLRVTDI